MPDRTISHSAFLASAPPVREVSADDVAAKLVGARKVVVIDDDPTGTQTTAGLPVLTRWTVDDIRWAMREAVPGFFILTNSRSLSAPAAAAVTAEVARACAEAAALERLDYVFASRSDSTLRGHFPLETDVLARQLSHDGIAVDGLLLVPAYVDAGRVTVDSVHLLRLGDELVPVGHSEFARDATFGYAESDLRAWVAEKTGGAVPAADVRTVTLADLRGSGVAGVARRIGALEGGQVAVVDALVDDDLRVLSLAILDAERAGRRFIYRIGPSFVRARLGQQAAPPMSDTNLQSVFRAAAKDADDAVNGLVVVGSHTALTTRQLEGLRDSLSVIDFELDVHLLRDEARAEEVCADLSERVAKAIRHATVVLSTSRAPVVGADGEQSLAFARRVSASLARIVREATRRCRPAFVVAKGGITSSDIATEALGIVRARTRGTLLPGIVSLWEPIEGPAARIPYVVFAGNVGGDQSLAEVVGALVGAASAAADTERRVS